MEYLSFILTHLQNNENGYSIIIVKFIEKDVMITLGGKNMEVGLIIILFLSNAFALDCLYNKKIKTTGALLILNLCLTVALAYQFEQMGKIVHLLLCLIAMIVLFFGVKFYLKKKKENTTDQRRMIEEKEDEL